MRLQTMYVDMRPMLTKWLGVICFVVFLVLLIISLQSDFKRAAEAAKVAYDQSRKGGAFDFGYLDHCLRSASCAKSFLVTWTAPNHLKAFILGGMGFGMLTAIFGLVWRPEVVAMRDTRVNAAKVEESRLKSPQPPRRVV